MAVYCVQIVHNNASVRVCTHTCVYSLPHTHALGPSRCSSPHLFKNLSVIRTIQLFFGYGGQREGWLGRQWSAYSPSPSLFCISQVMIDSSRLQRPSASYTTAESVNWEGGMVGHSVYLWGWVSWPWMLCELWCVCLFCPYNQMLTYPVCAWMHIGTALLSAAICFQFEGFWKSQCSCVLVPKIWLGTRGNFQALALNLCDQVTAAK